MLSFWSPAVLVASNLEVPKYREAAQASTVWQALRWKCKARVLDQSPPREKSVDVRCSPKDHTAIKELLARSVVMTGA